VKLDLCDKGENLIMYDLYELADDLAVEIEDTGKTRWSARDVKNFFLDRGLNLSLDEIMQIWNICPSPVCASKLLMFGEAIMATSELDLKPVTINFGDGNSAASRGTEPETDCEIHGNVSSKDLALAAAYVVLSLDEGFTDEDVISAVADFEGYDDLTIDELESVNWSEELSVKDISGGDALVYRVTFNGQEIYYDEALENEVLQSCAEAMEEWDEDDYD